METEPENVTVKEFEKKSTRFTKFFSSVSSLTVAKSTPVETQLELMKALREVEAILIPMDIWA